MGRITVDGQDTALRAHHLIGRSRAMHSAIRSPDVSAQHLALIWMGQGWVVRDLASRNGTFVDGVRVTAGLDTPVRAGSVLFLGTEAVRIVITDDGPPVIVATCEGDERVGDEDFLALPSRDEPTAVVMRDPVQGWLCSMDETTSVVEDGDEVVVDGVRWVLQLPTSLDGTVDASKPVAPSGPFELQFRVSSDEEYVEVTALIDGRPVPLPPRSYHYLLLTLARARVQDTDASSAEQGWCYRDDLRTQLRMSSNQFYVSLHRARRQFAEIAGTDGLDLFEERRTSRQMRLATPAIRISSLT